MIVIFSAEYELIASKKKAEGWIVECEILKLKGVIHINFVRNKEIQEMNDDYVVC